MWWPLMSKDVIDTLKQCETCKKFQTLKAPKKSVIPWQNEEPYEQWAINIIGPIPGSTKK